MAKGKGGKAKGRKDQTPEEAKKAKAAKLELERIKKQEMMEAEQKALIQKYHEEVRENNIRDFVLLENIKTFDAMRHDYQKLQAELSIKQKWDDYVNCVNLPGGSDVPELRAFLHEWQSELVYSFESHISWVIDVNERSLLNQDRDIKNMCFKKLWNDQPMIGDGFIRRMRNAYRLIHEIEEAIRTTSLPYLKSELNEIREKFRKQMKTTIDLFAYRLLTNIERDMSRIGTHQAKHNYESEIFRASVWTSRPVPQIPKCWLVEHINEIAFPLFQSSLVCPEDMEIDGYSFRSLWTNYDHYSDTAPSVNLKVEDLHLNDLRASNKADRSKMQELREIKLNEMIKVRTEWEGAEKNRIAAEEAEAKSKKNKDVKKPTKKRVRKVKQMPEPPPANKDTIVAIDVEFQEYDEDQYKQLQDMTSPETLNLVEDEVNLRSFYMLGGIFEFNHLKRPAQFNQISDSMLLRLNDGRILEYIDFNPEYQNDPTYYDELIEINVKLNDKVCWWTTPTVAYWEPWEKSDEFLNLTPELQDFHLNYEKYVDKIRSRLFSEPDIKLNASLIKCVKDFKVDAFPEDIGFIEFIKFYLIPRIPLSYKFKSEVEQEREIIRKQNLRMKEVEMEHQEEKDRKRQIFEEEMVQYKAKADAERNEMINTKRAQMQEEREQTRIKLVNQGENDKQIEKHLKFKEETDEKILHELEMDEILKYHDYYSEQYELKFSAELQSTESVVVHRTPAVKTVPADLYPPFAKQLPLRVSLPEHKSICFDCPTIEDSEQIEIDENEDSDQMLLSTFLQYLKILYHKSLPQLQKHKLIGNRDSVSVPVKVIRHTVERQASIDKQIVNNEIRNSSISQKGRASLIENVLKSKLKFSKGKDKKFPKRDTKTEKGLLDSKTMDIKPGERKSIHNAKGLSKSLRGTRSSSTIVSITSNNEKKQKIIHHKAPPMQLIPHAAGKWMTSGIYFTEFDPTTGYIKYKTSHLGPFGFGMPKYCNYPLKYWEVYPNLTKKAAVLLKIIGNFCEIKFEITEDGYFIERILPNVIKFEPNKTAMSYDELKKFLKESGIINFPKDDTDHYINGVAEKHVIMEWHTFKCLAQFTLSYYFKRSDFNTRLDRRSAIFESCQLHETGILDLKKLEFDEILVSTLRANIVKTVEIPIKKDSTETKLEHHLVPEIQDFYPDVLTLLLNRSHDISIKKHQQMKPRFRFNVARLLCDLRPFSFTA